LKLKHWRGLQGKSGREGARNGDLRGAVPGNGRGAAQMVSDAISFSFFSSGVAGLSAHLSRVSGVANIARRLLAVDAISRTIRTTIEGKCR